MSQTKQLVADAYPEVSAAELELIIEAIRTTSGELLEFAPGEILSDIGSSSDDLWVILSGSFSVTNEAAYLGEVGPGTVVGEVGALTPGHKHSARVAAQRAATALRLSKVKLSEILADEKQAAAWYHLLAASLVHKLQTTNQNYIDYTNSVLEKEKLLKQFVCEFSLSHVRAYMHGDANLFKRVKALVWFSDLVGFSEHIFNLEEDEAGRVTRNLLQIQAEKLAAAGAHLDKFMGDGVMAYWIDDELESPSTIARRAVEAAIEVSEAIPRVSSGFGLNADIRIGLHYGAAIAGNFGSNDRIAHTLVGPDVNLAARYEQVHPRNGDRALGSVRISPAVFELAPAELRRQFNGATLHEVKHGLEIMVHDGPVS